VQVRHDERRDQQEHADADGDRFLAPGAHKVPAYGFGGFGALIVALRRKARRNH
jgi:hypothetical protein